MTLNSLNELLDNYRQSELGLREKIHQYEDASQELRNLGDAHLICSLCIEELENYVRLIEQGEFEEIVNSDEGYLRILIEVNFVLNDPSENRFSPRLFDEHLDENEFSDAESNSLTDQEAHITMWQRASEFVSVFLCWNLAAVRVAPGREDDHHNIFESEGNIPMPGSHWAMYAAADY